MIKNSRKRLASQAISGENDLVITDDVFLNISRRIFIDHFYDTYQKLDLSLYVIEPCRHPEYPNLSVTPHFVRDDGVIIYLQLLHNDVYLKIVEDEMVNLSMEILKTENSIVYTITVDPVIKISDVMLGVIPLNSVKIQERFFKYIPNLVSKYISSVQRPKIECPIVGFSKDEWVSASKTRNFALKDTLVDWLDLYYHRSRIQPNYSKNREYDFSKFIMDKGNKFEENVIKLIKEKFSPNEFITVCKNPHTCSNQEILEYEKKSINEILKGTPIIYQPIIMNRNGTLSYSYGLPDLLVRSDYLSKLVEFDPIDDEERNHKAVHLNGNYHYVIVDIKFATLELCADGKRIRNNGSIPAYKCQLYIYNHAIGLIQGYEPKQSYILGRKYRYDCKGQTYSENNCFARFGHIEYNDWDKNYINEAVSAINWIKNLRTYGKEWKLLPTPSVPELYPNMSSICESHWDSFKMNYAKEIGELTLLWNCGVKNREIAHKKGIFSYKDPNCTADNIGIKGTKQGPILDQIIKINQKQKFKSKMDRIDMKINTDINNTWLDKYKLRLSVDFEIINGVFDDFKSLPQSQDQCMLFMVGVSYQIPDHKPEYKTFIASELSKQAQLDMMLKFYTFVRNLTDQYLGTHSDIPFLYHWGHIERTFFSSLCEKLQTLYPRNVKKDITLMQTGLKWFDLLECFKENPIVVNGCFKFGLKEIAKRLADLGLINSTWDSSCVDGTTAMIMAHKSYQISKEENIPVDQTPLMNEIINYNKIDCEIIHEIIDIIKKKCKLM